MADERHEHDEKAKLDKRLVDLTSELSDYTRGLFKATVALAIATGLLVAVTVGLVIFARRQARDMQDSIVIAKQSAKAAEDSATIADRALRVTQRAYIGVEPKGIKPFRRKRENAPVGEAQDLIGHFVIHNVGNLPARDVSWVSDFICDGRRDWRPEWYVRDLADKRPSTDVPGTMVVTPGTRVRRATKIIPNTTLLQPPDNAKAWYCYVWGRVRYKDGFDVERTTDFCHRYNCDALVDDNEIPARHARYHEYGGNDAT